MWLMTLYDHPWVMGQWAVVIAACTFGAFLDIRERRLPNFLTGPLCLMGFAWAAGIGGWAGLADSLTACAALALPYILLFAFAGGGAGDAKMMGAIGAWMGLVNGLAVLFAVALAGAVLGIVVTILRKEGRIVAGNMVSISYNVFAYMGGVNSLEEMKSQMPPTEQMRTMPYGIAIFAGVCFAAVGMYLYQA